MAPEERRASIIDAACATVLADSQDFSARAVAEAAGVAEGTIFRYFPTLNDLLGAVVCRIMDPAGACAAIRAIDSASLDQRCRDILEVMRSAMEQAGRIFQLVNRMGGELPRQHSHEQHAEQVRLLQHEIASALEPFAAELRFPLSTAAAHLHTAAFTASHPMLGQLAPTTDELVDILLHGLRETA